MSKDYYKILGVGKTATAEEIKKAFREKAHKYHPDKAGGDEARFKEVNEAYQVLGNAEKRKQYDQFGSTFEQARAQGGFSGFEGFRDFSNYANGFNINVDDLGDIFGGLGDIFGFGARTGGGRRPKRGRDLEFNIELDFREAVFGAEKEISLKKKTVCAACGGSGAKDKSGAEACAACGGSGRVTRSQSTFFGPMRVQSVCPTCRGEGRVIKSPCPACGGSGAVIKASVIKVKIPAGIDDGQAVRLAGLGEAGERGAPAGDLFVRVSVRPDARFERDGTAVKSEARIGFRLAALGGKIEVETVDGPVSLKVPAGTQSGTVFRLKNKGVPNIGGRGRGDHYVSVIVVTPANLSRRDRETLAGMEI